MKGRPKTKNRKPVIINLDEEIKILAKAHGVKNFSDWVNSIAKVALSSNSVGLQTIYFLSFKYNFTNTRGSEAHD